MKHKNSRTSLRCSNANAVYLPGQGKKQLWSRVVSREPGASNLARRPHRSSGPACQRRPLRLSNDSAVCPRGLWLCHQAHGEPYAPLLHQRAGSGKRLVVGAEPPIMVSAFNHVFWGLLRSMFCSFATWFLAKRFPSHALRSRKKGKVLHKL